MTPEAESFDSGCDALSEALDKLIALDVPEEKSYSPFFRAFLEAFDP